MERKLKEEGSGGLVAKGDGKMGEKEAAAPSLSLSLRLCIDGLGWSLSPSCKVTFYCRVVVLVLVLVLVSVLPLVFLAHCLYCV